MLKDSLYIFTICNILIGLGACSLVTAGPSYMPNMLGLDGVTLITTDKTINDHIVSFSTKRKGDGIGFAGVGAKLFIQSKQGGQIITITGKGEKDFMASKMHLTDDLHFKTTKKYPLEEILEIPVFLL